ncbi:alpha/beta hydrolase [Microlunatus flavus]|uniref:S-formylglutathione hydrolase FrmB n=1 Tax=Microlunatus flavus TaxID=1036181 RepID=A0A1H9LUF2_9ACTN|nr:alpha/beta hydrolase-fold protein [Microlunatus flavus]SER14493.1 S-formylglutathione hydrolase FrmB [Microlunatus flavus]
MGLTSHSLLVLSIVLACLAPVGLALLWRSRPHGRVLGTATRLVAVLLCQVLAVFSLFFYVNDQYSFYSSWADLFGRSAPAPGIRTAGLVRNGQGTIKTLAVAGGPTNEGSHQVLVWLPPGYDAPQNAQRRYPVLMFLPGQPSDPSTTFSHFGFADAAVQEIQSGKVAPFVAVFPPLMTDPPRDTECTNVPGGPQAENWLDQDVYSAVDRDLRTDHRPWTEIGWSTGAFCAAKLMLSHPQQFSAAVGLGGYYTPLTDHTTGNLFGNRPKLREENSPTWLYEHEDGMKGRRLLVVTGEQDRDSYAMSRAFLNLVGTDPGVSSVVFPTGGHNYRNYAAFVPQALEWLYHPHKG